MKTKPFYGYAIITKRGRLLPCFYNRKSDARWYADKERGEKVVLVSVKKA